MQENKDEKGKISTTISEVGSEELPEFIDVIKSGGICEASLAMFAEYCDCSTVHGVRYLGERKRSWIEKVFWLLTFAVSIYICFDLINNIWTKWNTSPVIVNFADRATPIWKVPMPMITICPDIKSRSEIFKFKDYLQSAKENVKIVDKWSDEEKNYMDMNLQICDSQETSDLNFTQKLFNGNVLETIKTMAPITKEMFALTSFSLTRQDYTMFFDEILTEIGLCYSFNLLPLEEIYRENVVTIVPVEKKRNTNWTLEKGYATKNDEFPFRLYGNSIQFGMLTLLYGRVQDFDSVCAKGHVGFKFSIGLPGEIPQLSKQLLSVPYNHEILVDITPELVTTSDSAKIYPPKIRSCFYGSEKYLKFFKVYNQANCELECLTNYTLKRCGCVRFSMPRIQNTPICGARNLDCYTIAKREYLEKEFNAVVKSLQHKHCNCLQMCTKLTYKIRVTVAPIQDLIEEEGKKISKLQFYFINSLFWSSERTKLYGRTEFIANAGGLLGLFMGISILSVVEFFYFFTIRLIGNIKIRYCSA